MNVSTFYGRLAVAIVSSVGVLLMVAATPHARDVSLPTGAGPSVTDDSIAVTTTIERFHRALSEGDSATALALLAPDVIVLESGYLETRAQYRADHLQADIAYARGVKSSRVAARVDITGAMAWVASTSTTRGQFRGRAVNSAGAELMVLKRTPAGWKIAAIHWSSRRNAP